MMDPLSAISLAGNVVQFVDFCCNLVSKSIEIHQSHESAPRDIISIEIATKDLTQLSSEVRNSIATATADDALERLCRSCIAVASELLQALSKVKANGNAQKWLSFRMALRSVWSKEKIRELEHRLAMLRGQLNLRLTADLREQILQLRLRQSDDYDKLDATGKKIVNAIVNQEDIFLAAQAAHSDMIKALHDDSAVQNEQEHKKTRQLVVDALYTRFPDEKQAKISQWLSPPDPSINHHKALKECLPGTGVWLLKSRSYTKWKSRGATLLWLYGIPGCGKTVLSSTVIEDMRHHSHRPDAAVVYFYFDFRDSQKQISEQMVKSLVNQLSRFCTETSPAMMSLFSLLDKAHYVSMDTLLAILQQVVQELPETYMVVDALDECNDRHELLEVVQKMAGWQQENLHILVTSRRELDIEYSLEKLTDENSAVDLRARLVDQDIEAYVDYRLSTDKDLQKWGRDAKLREEIIMVLMKKARGMFRWAVCQLDSLSKCLSRGKVRKSLADLPSTLDETYDRILLNIDENYSEYARCILQWLAFSARPLRLEQIAEVVAIDIKQNTFDPEEALEDPSDVLKICSSLVTTTSVNGWNTELEDKQGGDRHSDFSDPGGDSIASEPGDDKFNVSDFEYNATETDVTETALVFAHYSVKEYLISDRIQKGHAARYGIQDDACNSMIAKSCLSYLLQFKFPVSIGLGTIETFKLARYAAEFWTHHARSAGEDADTLNGLIIDFLTNGDGAYFNSIRLYNEADRYRSYYCVIDLEGLETVQRAPSPLIYASLAGLTKIVYLLIKSPDVDVKARERGLYPYETALQAASGEGHTAIVELLLAAEADVNGRGGTAYSGGALHEASRKGHKAIVELLLAAGADVDARGWGATALQIASLYGHEGIVKLLIAAGADVDEQEYEDTALQGASQNGYEAIVKLLVAAGANVNIQGRGHKTALHAASRAGHEAIVELLLAAGADVNAWERDSTVLQIAARHGNEGVVKLLLAAGANVDAQGEELGTALQAAARYGYEAVVKLLLAAGADVNERGIVYDSPLHLAIESGCEAIVELLLAAGATKDIGSSEGDVSL